jgi:chorismate mutase/prephenate dehydrogenase
MSDQSSVTPDELLAKSREEIDSIDAGILKLLAQRRYAVGEVVRIKKDHGLPVYHPSREEDLISRRRSDAKALGLEPDMVEDILRTVLRGSRITQTRSLAGRAVRPGAKILLVGGRGEMGVCLGDWFRQAGYEVRILDKEDWESAETLCADIDLAVLAVPIALTGEVAQKLSPLLPAGCVLADITSTKSGPLKAMLEAHSGPVVGLHPMFGPTTHALDKQIVVVTAGREPESCSWVVEQLADWGAVIVEAEAEEHDHMMDMVQGLRHFATFAFGQFLCHSKVDLARQLEFSSPIYRLELGMVGRLFAQDPKLYADIIFSTPERRTLLIKYAKGILQNLELLENADEEAFLTEFREIAEWFGPFGDQAIRESSYLIDKMIERF